MQRKGPRVPGRGSVLSLSLALCLGGAAAASPVMAGTPAAASADRSAAGSTTLSPAQAEVRAAVDKFYEVAKAQDWDALASMLTEEYRLYTDGATVFERETYLGLLREEDLGVESMRLDDVEIEVAGDLAWVSFLGYFLHDADYEVNTAETLIFHRIDGEWKMAHSHASVRVLSDDGGAEDGESAAEKGSGSDH